MTFGRMDAISILIAMLELNARDLKNRWRDKINEPSRNGVSGRPQKRPLPLSQVRQYLHSR